MAASAEALPAASGARRSFGPGLSIGVTTLYLSVIVLLPLAALSWRAHGWGAVGMIIKHAAPDDVFQALRRAVTSPLTLAPETPGGA